MGVGVEACASLKTTEIIGAKRQIKQSRTKYQSQKKTANPIDLSTRETGRILMNKKHAETEITRKIGKVILRLKKMIPPSPSMPPLIVFSGILRSQHKKISTAKTTTITFTTTDNE